MRVLVVEDEKRLANGLRSGLEAEGFAVDVALTGTDGLSMARTEPYDAIVLDIMLPGVNGFRVCSTLRDEGVWTPILMLTAKEGEWDEVEALDSGADDYLTKPFSYAVLLARLRALLRRGAQERPTVLEAGDLRYDPAARRAWRGDEEIDLTARERSLLEFLLRHKGETVTKREILEHVWDYDFEGDVNIIEVYIRHLRNKLDRPFGRSSIETVRGSGYRLMSVAPDAPAGPAFGGWWHRRGTVRVRTTGAAVVVVGVAIVVGSVALVATLRAALTGDVRDATELRAREIAVALETGESPALAIGEADEQFIQVLGPGGVVAASDNVEDLGALAQLSPGESTVFEPPIGDDDFVAYATGADTPAGELTVIFGRSLDEVSDSTEAVTGLLVVAGPVLLLLVGATTWVVVGRALAPVEAIRSEVDEISTSELHRRVPVPGAEDEVARLARTMNRMLGRLEDGQSRQRRFVADAAHELRSPVASIRQHAEVARAHPDRSSIAELSDTVVAESQRVQRLVDDLLLLARFDERRLDLAARPVDVDDVVFAEASRLRSDTTLRIDTRQVSAGRVRGDEMALQRIVRNLGDNAARHATSTVAFALTDRDGTVELVVDDDGPGIARVDRDRIFERFVRLDEARSRDQGGSGLGLAIVAELAAAHRASIEVTDSLLGGARFRLRFPAAG